jgi:hypothetical protein
MRRGVVMALVLGAAALAGPSGAGASVTQEDRDFAAAVRAYDAATLAVTHDPALRGAVRARQQAAIACVDTARALGGRRDDGAEFIAATFYALHVIAPVEVALIPATDRYIHTLRGLRLRNPVLRSARAVLLLSARAVGAVGGTPADFCGPLRGWQDARFDLHAIPAPIDAALAAFRRGPGQSGERATRLRRASIRLRAVGVRLTVRERFVGVRNALNVDALFKDDQVLAALGAKVGGP